MPVHPAMAGKFPLLEGVSSVPELFENPALADRRQAFEDHGGFVPPAVTTRMDEAPGPHGPVPVRIYALAVAGVDVRQVQVRTMLHGFLNLPASIEPVSGALDLIAEAVAGRVRPGAAAR